MADEHNRGFQALVIVLQRISAELVNMSIENDVYRELIQASGIAVPELLDEIRKNALADPGRRAQAQIDFSDMLEALKQAGIAAGFEEMLNTLPPTDKPN